MANRSEGGPIEAMGERLRVGPGAGNGEAFAKLVAVIGAVGTHDRSGSEAVEQAGRTLSVMSLAFGQLEWDAYGIGDREGMDPGV